MAVPKKVLKRQTLRNIEYYGLQEIFDELYQKSLENRKFRNLMELILMEENIKLAYRNMKKNDGSTTPGVDGKTIEHLAKMTEKEVIELVRNKLEWYTPKAIRRVEIDKGNGKKRPLGIASIEDRLIQQCILQGTFDAYLYQLVENKQKFIAQIMTSKAPVRVADDVDETALSYSEIKALATGNPLIIEKCNLDMEVARLNMLKASHLNQVYALEELVYRKYPEEITRLTERIAGYEQDVALAAAHPKAQEGFCGMEVDGRHYTEKEGAGKAIIDVCTRMTGSDAVLLGQYRGFSMVLAYDGRSNEYRITLKGTLSHTVTLGADVFGNITRLDNALENLAGSLQAEQNSLEETKAQLENARTELATPFAREEELAEKTARLKELNILLNMDEKDKTLMDDTPDEGEDVPARRVAELAR